MKKTGVICMVLAAVLVFSATFSSTAAAQSASQTKLSAEWWQWILSIPETESPFFDGSECVVGQRGSVWFLAGTFGGGTTRRNCTVPEGKTLFVPVINMVAFDTPGVCGQDSERIPAKTYREQARDFIDGATKLAAEVDGTPVRNFRRAKSPVFELALPAANVFNPLCAGSGGLPGGIYSPAVADGYYLTLKPLDVGVHTLHIHAENPEAAFVLDVTYDLDVVPVVKK